MHKNIDVMNKTKIILISTIFLALLNGCAQNVALVGPAYAFVSTGNVYQAGLTYGSNEAVNKLTGKSTSENIKEILTPKKDDSEFAKLVKNRIKETRKKLKLPSE
tara:strand:- start:156 stop:470 length:315 start_codon:yes stop_codon:yes gene_type:complete